MESSGEKFCLIASLGKGVLLLVCGSSRCRRGGGRRDIIFDEKKILWDRQLVKWVISLCCWSVQLAEKKFTLAFSRGWEDMSAIRM